LESINSGKPTRPIPGPHADEVPAEQLAASGLILLPLQPRASFTLREEIHRDGTRRAVFGPANYGPSPLWTRYRKLTTCGKAERERRAKALAEDILAAMDEEALNRILAAMDEDAKTLPVVRRKRALDRLSSELSERPAATNHGGLRPPHQSPRDLARALAARLLFRSERTISNRTDMTTKPGNVYVMGNMPRPVAGVDPVTGEPAILWPTVSRRTRRSEQRRRSGIVSG
jgi:hypothetical protein